MKERRWRKSSYGTSSSSALVAESGFILKYTLKQQDDLKIEWVMGLEICDV
jgi:hypothetical protein